jgi:3-oxoacyl-[acyl-carrier protein] reductase
MVTYDIGRQRERKGIRWTSSSRPQIIINGGSAGLGFGTALALAHEGVNLYISARNEARLLEACAAIRSATGSKVEAIVADHATTDGRRHILERCPAPDILVGTCSPPPYIEDFRSISEEDWRQNLDSP